MENFAERVDNTFFYIAGISVFLLFSITVFMIYCLIRFNRRRNPMPADISENLYLEIAWTIIPIILVLSMFYYGWTGYRVLGKIPEGSMDVNVTARMWSWTFRYENGKESDQLYVPAGKPVKLTITSMDVIHSLYIPALRIKQDAVPGMKTHLWFKADIKGEYDILCAEYCGLRHSYMLSKLIVMPEEDFLKWYDGRDIKKLK